MLRHTIYNIGVQDSPGLLAWPGHVRRSGTPRAVLNYF